MTAAPTEARRSAWIPWAFVAAFLIVVAANGVLIAVAMSTFNGLTSEDAYAEGVAFNRTLDQAADQARLGWAIAPSFQASGDRAGDLALFATAKDGSAILGATVTVHFVRPTQAGHDFTAALEAHGDGRYGAAVAFPLAGVWDARIEFARDGDVIRWTRRIVVP